MSNKNDGYIQKHTPQQTYNKDGRQDYSKYPPVVVYVNAYREDISAPYRLEDSADWNGKHTGRLAKIRLTFTPATRRVIAEVVE